MPLQEAKRGRSGARLAVVALCGAVACSGDSPSPIEPPLEAATIAVTGRAERGLVVQVTGKRGSRTLPAESLTVTVSPVDAATVGAAGALTLKKEGTLTVTGRFADGATATADVNVARPPVILFDMVVDGNRDVYRIALDGAELQRLTTDPAEDVSPTSAGGRVVFTSYRDGNAELYAISAAGATSRLTTSADHETQPALSPNGQRIAYVRDDGVTQRVYTADANAAGAARLTGNYGFSAMVEAGPSWSANSDSVALMSSALGNASIFLVRAQSGSTPSVLVAAAGDSGRVEPAWTRGAPSLAFVSGPLVSQIFIFDRASARATPLTTGTDGAGQPAWLSDGRLVFTRFVSGVGSLRWMDPASPGVSHPIVTSGTNAQRPTPLIP